MRKYVSEKECPDDMQRLERLMIQDYVLISANTGLRVGEIRQLTWDDVLGYEEHITDEKTDLYIENLTKKMLVYALGRGLEFYDERVVDRIVRRLKSAEYCHDELIMGIVKSLPFDMKRGESSN